MTAALKENLEWLEEMECPCISNIEINSRCGFDVMPLEKLARELKKMDLVRPAVSKHRSRCQTRYSGPGGSVLTLELCHGMP